MKILIALVLVLISVLSGCAKDTTVADQKPLDEWVVTGKSSDATRYVYKASIKRIGNGAAYWSKMDFGSPQNVGGSLVSSYKSFREADCNAKSSRTITLVMYSGKALTGQTLMDHTDQDAVYQPATPDSLGWDEIEYVCTATAFNDGWFLVREDSVGSRYHAPQTMRRVGDVVKVYTLMDYSNPEGRHKAKSVKMLAHFDCRADTFRISGLTYFSENMGRGKVIDTVDRLSEIYPIPPGSIAAQQIDLVCRNPKK